MTPERWQRVKALFAAAQDLDLAERETFVASNSDTDPEVGRQVLDLLAAATRVEANGFIEQPAVRLVSEGEGGLAEGYRLGPWRIERELGRGGMGAVYLAARADAEYEKKVALKILRWGIGSEDLVQRFRRERQILASFQHPNIAALLDGGTASGGVSYFVMEYVDGVPLDDYCTAHHLTERARLELFRTVCLAVHVAHRNLIVHRDLKPANILVTAEGVPKLLDFGIAKLLDVPDSATQALATPKFASPEQLAGGPITTSTDIYSLGLLLHLLLVGHLPPRPWETAAAGGALASAPRLRGDLARIVAMALRQDPAQRYSSAPAFAEDIQRYLDGQPIAARTASWTYRTVKFVHRHRAGVAAAALILALVVVTAGFVYVTRSRAERQRLQATTLTSFLVQLFSASSPKESRGDTITARDLLDRGWQQIQTQLANVPENRADVMESMCRAYIGLGLYEQVLPRSRDTVALRRATLGNYDPKLAESLHTLAQVLHRLNDDKGAEPYLREALAIQRRNARGNDDPELARGLNNFAGLLQSIGHIDEAEQLYREVLSMKRRLYQGDHSDVAMALRNLAGLRLQDRRDYAGAEDLYGQALDMWRRLRGTKPDPDVAETLAGLAFAHEDAHDMTGAEAYGQQALDMRVKLNPYSPDTAASYNNLGSVRQERGDMAGAEKLFRKALDVYDQGHLDSNSLYHAVIERNLADLLCKSDPTQGAPLARQVLSAWQRKDPSHWRTADAESVLGGCLAAQHHVAEAEQLLTSGYKNLAAQPSGPSFSYAQQALVRLKAFYATLPADERARGNRLLMAASTAPARPPGGR